MVGGGAGVADGGVEGKGVIASDVDSDPEDLAATWMTYAQTPPVGSCAGPPSYQHAYEMSALSGMRQMVMQEDEEQEDRAFSPEEKVQKV